MNNSEIIYHGSYMNIEFPKICKHRFTKDFSWDESIGKELFN